MKEILAGMCFIGARISFIRTEEAIIGSEICGRRREPHAFRHLA